MPETPSAHTRRDAVLTPGWPALLPTIVLTPSELPGVSLCLTTVAYGRLPSVTKSVTIENLWQPREINVVLKVLDSQRRPLSFTRWGPTEQWMLAFVEKPLQ
jgi:hypothetical protein